MEKYLIIGDLHGCFFTWKELLKHWNPAEQFLIGVGDLIDRGNYGPQLVQSCMDLQQENEQVIFLKGNHEAELVDHYTRGVNDNWLQQCGKQTLVDFSKKDMNMDVVVSWFQKLPLKFETSGFLVTHAGVCDTPDPWDEEGEDSVLWTRKPLTAIGKLQIHGHTPLKQRSAVYTKASNSWNIDTGAYYGYGLCALLIDANGKVLDEIVQPTDPRDICL